MVFQHNLPQFCSLPVLNGISINHSSQISVMCYPGRWSVKSPISTREMPGPIIAWCLAEASSLPSSTSCSSLLCGRGDFSKARCDWKRSTTREREYEVLYSKDMQSISQKYYVNGKGPNEGPRVTQSHLESLPIAMARKHTRVRSIHLTMMRSLLLQCSSALLSASLGNPEAARARQIVVCRDL